MKISYLEKIIRETSKRKVVKIKSVVTLLLLVNYENDMNSSLISHVMSCQRG